MKNLRNKLAKFEKKYFEIKWYKFYKPQSREFIYDCIKYDIYNTELVLCIDWIKPVSKFIVDKYEHLDFIKKWLETKWVYMEYRELKKHEADININDKINYIVYTWKDINIVKNTLQWDLDNSAEIWELLWYPKCCSEKWDYDWVIWKQKNYIDFFKKYISWKNLPLLNNPFFNFISTSLSFYYPCKLDCKKSLDKHTKFANIIKKDNPDFFKKIETFFSLPILFIFPNNSSTLTFNLHFDEIFRIFFVWVIKWDTVYYRNFFIVSYSFLDQEIEEDYKIDCIKILELLIDGDNFRINDNEIFIWKGDKIKKYKMNHSMQIVKFDK